MMTVSDVMGLPGKSYGSSASSNTLSTELTVTDVEEDFNADQYDEEAELVPTDIDETKNVPAEVDESENEIEREAKSEFDGTDATASVEDIF